MNTYYLVLGGAVGLFLLYAITKLLFDFLLRGFAPFISSRPWAVSCLIEELDKEKIKFNPVIYSLSCGKSGFLYEIGKHLPGATLIGVETNKLAYILERAQLFLRRTRIKAIFEPRIYKIDVGDADLIYCYLDIDELRDLPKKLKFECKQGTVIISNGFPIPMMQERRVVEISDQQRKFNFFNRKKAKASENKRSNSVYFYQI